MKMKHRQWVVLLLAFLLVFSLAGCAGDSATGSASGDNAAEATGSETTTADSTETTVSDTTATPTKDRAGYDIEVPENVNSIITMAPSITQVIVDLGLGDKLVAIDAYSSDIEGLPSDLPQFDIMNPDAESIIALKPDIVFASGMSQSDGTDPFKPLKDVGICIIYIPSSDSIQSIKDDITFIGAVTGKADEGQVLIDNMETAIERIAAIGATIPDSEKKTVYFEIAPAPNIYSFGKGVFLDEMINIIGAKNAFEGSDSWIGLSEEVVINADPDIIMTNVDYVDKPLEAIKSRAGWTEMKAIKNNDVYMIDNMSSSLPNHHIIKALEEMGKAVYPDKF
ncbi:MAG: cobalamin transport system substrate-binding protein [Clostridiales bacterium]|jgi:iron complex transport system substrate-binding protein|nr:cobalamin transport system substrate-binding protein [Clostridiales bacterium]MDN5300181.1 cobalamin transport system substrate-binding protein [Clostridiales bacterium]